MQPIAADLGVTDVAICHHFRNREGLLDALSRRGARRLRESVEAILAGWDEEELPIQALVDAMIDTFERRRYAKLILWLADAGVPSDRGSGMFDAVAPLVGSMSRRSVGLGGGRPTTNRFRAWLAAAIAELLERGAEGSPR